MDHLSALGTYLTDGYFAAKCSMPKVCYNWRVSQRSWNSLPLDFEPRNYLHPSDTNKALKRRIASWWPTANIKQQCEVARWIISDWGGIRANKDETIARYVKMANEVAPTTPILGVASYSKVLAFTRPNSFAIYDARVAAALNALQLKYVPEYKRLYFKDIAGRNSKVESFKKRFSIMGHPTKGFRPISPNEVYSSYLALLQIMSSRLPSYSIEDFEMELFTAAVDICDGACELSRS